MHIVKQVHNKLKSAINIDILPPTISDDYPEDEEALYENLQKDYGYTADRTGLVVQYVHNGTDVDEAIKSMETVKFQSSEDTHDTSEELSEEDIPPDDPKEYARWALNKHIRPLSYPNMDKSIKENDAIKKRQAGDPLYNNSPKMYPKDE